MTQKGERGRKKWMGSVYQPCKGFLIDRANASVFAPNTSQTVANMSVNISQLVVPNVVGHNMSSPWVSSRKCDLVAQ